MPFPALNLILLMLGLYVYIFFRCGVYAYCRMSKMSKTYIRKNRKGYSNYWLYSRLHKKNDLGALYYLNLVYLFCLSAFLIAFPFSWVSLFRIPVMVIGILLGAASIPVFIISLIYRNIESVGQAFVFFKVYKEYNGRSRSFATVLDWLVAFVPLALYIFLLTKIN